VRILRRTLCKFGWTVGMGKGIKGDVERIIERVWTSNTDGREDGAVAGVVLFGVFEADVLLGLTVGLESVSPGSLLG
jgi:hypothetical protein